jgi:hypothetical protein
MNRVQTVSANACANRRFGRRNPLVGALLPVVLALGASGVASGQNPGFGPNTNSTTFNLLTWNDGGICSPQAGAYFPFDDTGCCGVGGRRPCASIPACVAPASYNSSAVTCDLPSGGTIQPSGGPGTRPIARPANGGTNISFLVASDTHFYRTIYNVGDQTLFPYTVNQYVLNSGVPYSAVMVAGDLTDSADDQLYPSYPSRLDAYRLLWENNLWVVGNPTGLAGASIGIPTFPTFGNHDTCGNSSDTVDCPGGNAPMWNYLEYLTADLYADRNHTGCLVDITPGCIDETTNGGSLNYSFDWQGVHFLMLNTWAGDQNQYIPPNGSNGMAWLQNDLAYHVGYSGRPVVIVQHYGLYDTQWGSPWWTTQNVQQFENAIAGYNVVAWFSGHTHSLGVYSDPNAINTGALDPNGIGNTLDNFVDGNAGDCSYRGQGTTNTNGNADNATYCYNATMDFLTVTLTDKYLTVGAVSFANGTPPYNDNTIGNNADYRSNNTGMAGTNSTNTSSCVKRLFVAGYQDISSQVTLTANSSQITVTNKTSNSIQGPLAVWVKNSSIDPLTQWDFVDSCDASNAHQFLLLTEAGTLYPNSPMSISYSSIQHTLSSSRLHLYQLSDALQVSPAVPSVGATPVQVTLSMTSGANVPFTYELNPSADYIQQTWLTVTADSTTLPATLTLTPIILPAGDYTSTDQVIQISPAVVGLSPTTLKVNLLEGTLSLSSNLPGATVRAYPPNCETPQCTEPQPLPTSFATLSATVIAQPPPAAPAGTRYSFSGWGDGEAATHTVEVPLTGYPLKEFYEVDYQITTAASSGGTVSISPASPTNDGYYQAFPNATSLTITATPNSGYYFAGFTGNSGLSGTTNPQTLTVTGSATIGANFYPMTTISVVPSNGIIYVDNVAYTGSTTFPNATSASLTTTPWTPGTIHTVDASKTYVGPGTNQAFLNWGLPTGASFVCPPSSPAGPCTYALPSGASSVLASFNISNLLTLAASPTAGGSLTASPTSTTGDAAGYYGPNTNITITATAATGYYFKTMTLPGGNSPSPAITVINQPSTVTGVFGTDPAITLQSAPSGQIIYVDGVAVMTPQTYTTWVPGSTHTLDASTTATNTVGEHQTWTKWEGRSNSASFTYSVPDGNTTLTADFNLSYLLTLNANGPGTLAALPVSPTADGYYGSGTSVSITATPNATYSFLGFSGGIGGTANPGSIMMNAPETVTGSFGVNQTAVSFTTNVAASEGSTITVNGAPHPSTQFTQQLAVGAQFSISVPTAFLSLTNPGIQYVFTKWSDGTLGSGRTITVPSSPITYEAMYQTQALVTVTVTPAGAGTVAGGGWVNINTSPTLTATNASGFYFKNFSYGTTTTSTNPANIAVTTLPVTVTATFAADPVITVTSSPTGLLIYVDNVAITTPQIYTTWTPGSTHTLNAGQTATGMTGVHQTFVSWGDGSPVSYTYTVPITAATLTATFNLSYLLTLTSNGPGSIGTSTPSPTQDGYYPAATVVTIVASTPPNTTFNGFSGALTGTTTTQTLSMTGPESVAATFTANSATQPTLTFSTNVAVGQGASLTVNNTVYANSIALPFTAGASVSVQAPASFISATNPGIQYVFAGWSDGVTTASRTIIAPSTSTSYTAMYTTQVMLTVLVTPANGGTATGGGFVNAGSSPTLTATAATGYFFKDFTNTSFTNTTNPLKIAAGSLPFTVTAEFTTDPAITVTSIPTGLIVYVDGGAVTTPQTYTTWTPGSTHTLDASKTATGITGEHQTFVNWGDGSPVTYTLTVPATATTLTASFNLSYLLTLAVSGPGSIGAAPASPTGDGYYPSSTSVTVTATPNAGNYLTSFSGYLAGATNPQTFAMTAPESITAAFGADPVTTIQSSPAGGSATVDGTVTALPATLSWTPGSLHSVAFPTPQAGSPGQQFVFAGWSDGNTTNPRQITAGAAITYTGTYSTQYLVTATASPAAGGSVTGGGWYTAASTATLTATAGGGYEFTGFSGSITATVSPETVTVSGPLTVVAAFGAVTPRITVTASSIDDSDPNTVQLTLLLNNTGGGTAGGLTVSSITPKVLTGSGTVTVEGLPLNANSLPGGQSVLLPVTIAWPSSATRISLVVQFTADNGAYNGSQTLTMFR